MTKNANTAAEQASMDELIKLIEQRAATYSLLSRLFRVEIDQQLLDELHGMRFPASTGNADVDEGYLRLAKYLSNTWENSLTDLAVDYTRVFIGHGVDAYSAAYPFESVYTSEKRLLMQDARDEVLAIYRSAGLDKKNSWKEGEDHVALELEFEQVLANRTAEALRKGDEDTGGGMCRTVVRFYHGNRGGSRRAADHAEKLPGRPSAVLGSHDDRRHEALRENRPVSRPGLSHRRVPEHR